MLTPRLFLILLTVATLATACMGLQRSTVSVPVKRDQLWYEAVRQARVLGRAEGRTELRCQAKARSATVCAQGDAIREHTTEVMEVAVYNETPDLKARFVRRTASLKRYKDNQGV